MATRNFALRHSVYAEPDYPEPEPEDPGYP
jgi:hypothetical protein